MTDQAANAFPDGVIDAHHHLYQRPGITYLAPDYLADLRATGIAFAGSIHVQARSHYRTTGPEALRPLGETEFLLGQVRQAAALGFPGLCHGIVGAADLTQGAAVARLIEGHLAVAGHVHDGGRFCGIRHILSWDSDTQLLNPAYPTGPDLMDDARFRAGLQVLADLGLAFDACLLAPQLPDLIRLARAMPRLRIVLNHCGGPVGVGVYAGRQPEMFAAWCRAMDDLAPLENVAVKLGGLGLPVAGLTVAPGTADLPAALARLWRPWVNHLLESFGPDRLMLQSNAPADRPGYPFAAGWTAFGHVLAPLSPSERRALCTGTAIRAYGLNPTIPPRSSTA